MKLIFSNIFLKKIYWITKHINKIKEMTLPQGIELFILQRGEIILEK